MEIKNANIFQELNGTAGAGKGSPLDLLGLSQKGVAESQSDFSSILEQLAGSSKGMPEGLEATLKNLLGEGIESPEQVLELIDQFPKDFKLNFLEELKSELPALVDNIQSDSKALSQFEFEPNEIVNKIQSIIDLVKEGGEKVSDAFKSVFDGGVFAKVFGDGEKVDPKVLNSLEANFKKLAENKANQNNPELKTTANSDDVVELHQLNKNQMKKSANQKQIKNFAQFNQSNKLIKENGNAALKANEAVNTDTNILEMKKVFKQGMKNPYAQKANSSSSMIKMNEVDPSQMKQDSAAKDFMGQGQNSQTTDMAAFLGQASQGNGTEAVQESVFNNKAASIDLNQVMSNSNSKADVIKNVTNYLEQVQFENQKELDVAVKHSELGDFNIRVSKQGRTNNLDLQIKAMTDEGVNFFQDNEVELMKTLNDKGIKLASLKIGSKGESSLSLGLDKQDSSGSNQQSKDGQSQSFSQQHRQNQGKDSGHERRKELWQKYQEQLAS